MFVNSLVKSAASWIALLALSLSASHAFAGAYSLNCASKDGAVKFTMGRVTVKTAEVSISEAEYIADSASGLAGSDFETFLKESGPKVAIDQPSVIGNENNVLKVISKRSFKDSCKNVGEQRKFSEIIRVLDMSGKQLLQAPIVCIERQISGHCI